MRAYVDGNGSQSSINACEFKKSCDESDESEDLKTMSEESIDSVLLLTADSSGVWAESRSHQHTCTTDAEEIR